MRNPLWPCPIWKPHEQLQFGNQDLNTETIGDWAGKCTRLCCLHFNWKQS